MSILGYSSPLEPTMAIMYLKNIDVARIMDVSHQVISKWLSVGVPVERAERIVTMDEIATILHHRLREGYVPTVVRRPAPGFDGKTFLELFVEGREQDVLDSVRASFDYASIA